MKKSILLIISFIYIFSGYSQQTPINVGDNIIDSLEFAGDVNSYVFCSAGDVPIHIRATSKEIGFLIFELFDPEGNKIASSSKHYSILASSPYSGQYTIVVKSESIGTRIGKFNLSLQRTINPIGALSSICNSAFVDSLRFPSQSKTYTFSVTSGASVNITISSSELHFELMDLYNESGEKIESSSWDEINVTNLDEGCYSLFAYTTWEETGSFSISLFITDGHCTETCPTYEICDNNIDDDGDGLIDCQDEDCCNYYILPTAIIQGDLEICSGDSSVLTASGGDSFSWSTGDSLSSISVTEAGEYTVTVTNEDGCSDTESAIVNVLESPVPTISGKLKFCAGETSILTAGGGVSYSWSTGENTRSIKVNTGNDYTVTVTGNNGCSKSKTVTVIVHPLPNITIEGDLEFCKGDYSTITATGGESYKWSTGANVPSITVTEQKSYTVTVTNANGCVNTKKIKVIVHKLPIATIEGDLEFCEGENSTLIANGGTNYNWSSGENQPVINVSTAGDFTVTVTDNNGCSNSKTVTVFVNKLPEAIIEGNLDICEGESSILTASGGTSYRWNTGDFGSTINVTDANKYIVTVTDNKGCSDSESVILNVNDLPEVKLILSIDTFCYDESPIVLVGGLPFGGEYSGVGVSGNIFNPSVAGVGKFTITYTYTDDNGCSNYESQEIAVNDCSSGTFDIRQNESFFVYPNPSNGNITIVNNIWKNKTKYQLIDLHGKIINSGILSSSKFELNNIPQGLYFLKVNNSHLNAIERILVQ